VIATTLVRSAPAPVASTPELDADAVVLEEAA